MSRIFDRRTFLKNSALLVTASPALSNPGSAPAGALTAGEEGSQVAALEGGFFEPSDAARPWVLWIVCDGTLTREGITADLEAMRRVGIRGVFLYEVDLFVPKGPARFLSPPWRELMQHAFKEATRLGIAMAIHNDGGYSGSGGPWITPELSMQMVVSSETFLEGPARFTGTLPQPLAIQDYYRDIQVLAFPTPYAESVRMAECSPKLTYGIDRKSFDDAALINGNASVVTLVPVTEHGKPQYLNIDFPEPFTAQALTVALDPWNSEISGTLEVSEDGERYQPLRSFPLRWPRSSVNFPKVKSRHYRLLLKAPDEEYNWLFRAYSKGFPLREVQLHTGPRIEDIPGKAAYIRQEGFSGEPPTLGEATVERRQILDLSSKMDGAGRLDWDVPAGKWTVLRMGHTSAGKTNHPAPPESIGLECDKLSKKAIEVHFAGLMEKLVEDQKAVGGKAFSIAHVDSWEVGSQNWTPEFREEFQKRRGYDPFPYFPVLTGRPVENTHISERFLWDLRRTVADLLLDNYARHLREISHQHGLTLSIEGYGSGPYEDVAYGACADVPMCEMWTGVPLWYDSLLSYCKEMASSAHVYGRPILASETFTAEPENAKWQNHPFRLKPIADLVFSLGVNRIAIHRYSMQPWLNRKPGMTFGPFGIQYERTTTYWEQTGPWHMYLTRCQHLLQKGRFVADVAYLASENAPQTSAKRDWMDPAIPAGYDFDIVPPEALLKYATVRDGRLVFASGMSYRLLVLPPGRTMTPALLAKIKELVIAGATVVGPRPARSPSLSNFPQCDDEVRRLAAELWGECDGAGVTQNQCGNGRVVWGRSLGEVLTSLGAPPDFACHDLNVGEQVRYLHRQIDTDDFYFVANAVPEARSFLCTFRVAGKRPELWWPDTGRIEPVAVYDERDGRTLIPLTLDPCGSVFVAFRGNAAPLPDRVVSVRNTGVELSGLSPAVIPEIQLQQEPGAISVKSNAAGGYLIEVAQPGLYELKTAAQRALQAKVAAIPDRLEIDGPWELEFPEGWGAPPRLTLERLISWTDHPDAGVKYFSGTATYRRRFEVPAKMLSRDCRFYLDLGRVAVIAEAELNGRDLGVLWKPPFRADITEIIRAGANELAVSVVNLWPNRLIGDDHLPPDCEWAPPSTPRNLTPHTWGGVLDHWPKWFLENKPSPTGRLTFTTWKHWSKDDPLLESGLLGPVRIIARAVLEVK
ncbi:MAG: hypothetical protein LAP13_19450 [Acidobacteriia bacterium]|nr:hypothetical protein [Terriglobia bacterium]